MNHSKGIKNRNSEEAIQKVIDRFPFEGYITDAAGECGAYSTIANTVTQYLPPGSKVLDFGCGPCDKTALMQCLGYRCCGYDDLQDDWHKQPGNVSKIIEFAKNFGIDFRLADGAAPPFEKNTFDMIMLQDVLEHLHSSPRDIINCLLELAKPKGLLFVTVPNVVNIRKRIDVLRGKTNLPPFEDYFWYPGTWRGHIREYSKDDLVKLCKFMNLDILELKGCDHMLQKLPSALRPLYLFITNFFPGWKDSWLLVAKKRVGWVPQNELHNESPRSQQIVRG